MPADLIGREHPADLIRSAAAQAHHGQGGLIMVTGEAGIGKTALVTKTLHEASRDGAVVAGGTCWDRKGSPGYWPWVQVVRSLERQLEPSAWAEAATAAGDGLAFLLGDFTEPPPMGDLDNAEFQLSDAVTTLLVAAARFRPVIVALDDLQWSDASSLRMLDFVVRHAWFERVLVVATYRDVEVDTPGHPVQEYVRPLEHRATTITLTGLDESGVKSLTTRVTGIEPDDAFVTETHRRTGGNPLFVEQLARLWQVGNRSEVAPPGIRDAVTRHLSYLPKPIVDALTDAAVIGPEFHRQTLAHVSAVPAAEVYQLLQQAAVTRLVVPLDSGRFAFAHDLVRELLYDSLDEAERRRRHAAVVQALIERPDEDVAAAHLAHHAYLAVPDIPATEAVGHLLAAGREAACRLASEEAGTHYRRALELVPESQRRRRTSVMLTLADQYRRTGRLDDARRAYAEGAELARDLSASDLITRAATALSELNERAELNEPPGLTPPTAEPAGAAGQASPVPNPASTPASTPGAQGRGLDSAPPSGDPAVFRCDGTVWTLSYSGRTVHLPDAKGLQDLHVLLGRPGVDVPAVELLARGAGDEARAARQLGGDAVLDETAKEQYRRRLEQIDEEIDRALGGQNDQLAAELDRERAALLDELRHASGLSGRDRRLGDEAERSRKTVTARIRDTMRRLGEHHPELASHLRACVSTGTVCRYQPDSDAGWAL